VSAIIYVQTCAAEKRRRRKRGQFPDPDKRVFINTDVCEGCGDCGVQSNCVSIVPKETELGRKRAIDQSPATRIFLPQGVLPVFVTLEGASRARGAPPSWTCRICPSRPAGIDGTITWSSPASAARAW
jgi:indolepyruvate ferredoxin oxidoreductase